jgi:hypothetical protein
MIAVARATISQTGSQGADKDREVYWSGRAQAIRMAAEVPVLLGKTLIFD